ncbi:MAG: CcmD family protein [Cyclobacteriaceae bacterium]|nr:CcmD family protein [Cyclobacteriaceae bacterium]
MNRIRLILVAIISGYSISTSAQTAEMADAMRSEGKIYVVVAILLVIFAGLISFLVLLDRKVTRIEKKIAEKEQQ